MNRTIRDVDNGRSRLARYRAERLLRRGFPELRARVLAVVGSKLRAAGVSLDRADLEACYSQAWHGLYARVLAGEAVESPEAWLVLVSFRRAIDEARAVSRARPGVGEDVASRESSSEGSEPDLADALDDRERLRALFEALRSRLSERECEAASLCYLQGLSRAEAAQRMGIGERRMRKLMEGPGGGASGVAGKVGELLGTISAGGWCDQQSSLMRAYAFGILDPQGERHALAVAHTRECPACRAHVAALRGLASVLPPLPFALAVWDGRSPSRRISHALRRAVATRPRPGPGTSAGWLSGRLAAQVAVSGMLAVGGGYALLGSRAHGGGLHRSHNVVSAPKRTGSAAGRLAVSHTKQVRLRTSPKNPAAAHTKASRHSVPKRPPAPAAQGPLSSAEFSPERAPNEARASAPVASAGHSEFGIE